MIEKRTNSVERKFGKLFKQDIELNLTVLEQQRLTSCWKRFRATDWSGSVSPMNGSAPVFFPSAYTKLGHNHFQQESLQPTL